MKNEIIDDTNRAASRRNFMRKLGLAGAAGAAVLGGASATLTAASGPTDADILQFALNLEYLEAEFYTVATTGKTIDQMGIDISGTGTPGPTTNGSQVNLFNSLVFTKDVAMQIADDERSHVKYLRTALMSKGVTPIAKPAINLNALGFGFKGQDDFLQLARIFEDIGVTAYGGAAPLLKDPMILGAAARILATEAEHAGNIRLQIGRLRIPTTKLDGVDVLPPPTGTDYMSVDSNALTQVRTPGQVLFLAYGFVQNATKGGFFPNGVNGILNTSSGPA